MARRNTIASLLSDWGLLDIVSNNFDDHTSLKEIKVISHRDKREWNLESKYTIGNAKGRAYS